MNISQVGMVRAWVVGVGMAAMLASGSSPIGGEPVTAQSSAGVRVFRLRETAGIRRTEYPASVSFQIPQGALPDTAHARVAYNSAEVAAQFTARALWPDGSVQTLDVDLNASLDPEEDRRYELQFGPNVTSASAPTRGLTVEDRPDAIQVGSLTFSKSGAPQLASASYRGEGIGTGNNGLTITDGNGTRHNLAKAQNAMLEVIKPGPLLAQLRYSALIPVEATVSIPVEVVLEMPNSKSWLKTTATVTDRTRRLRDVAIERPYAFSGFPVIWDFGTDSGTYGVFRAGTDRVTLTQTSTASGVTGWKIETGPLNQRRAVEVSAGARNKNASGWGHLQSANAALAFGFARFGRDAGIHSIALSGAGQATFRFAPTTASTQYQLTLYEHFVGVPVAVAAATNPTAMLTPLSVTVER
jgi:hypothetical protein